MTETLSAPRRLPRGGWVRDYPSMWTSGGYPYVLHIDGPDDISPVHHGYVALCTWCWVGAAHTEQAHGRRPKGAGL